jgi:hypothetical protein
MSHPAPQLWVRFLFFALLASGPILRLLILDRYGFFNPEVGVALAVHLGAALLLASITRNAFSYYAITLVLILATAAYPLQVTLGMRLRLVLPLLIVACVGLMYLLRDGFYRLSVIFLIASLGGDIIKAVLEGSSSDAATVQASGEKYDHTLHIIFDEMQGLGAMPADCVNCQIARAKLEAILTAGKFQVFPYAFSNYRGTRESIPSILNNRLLNGANQYFSSEQDAVLKDNLYFDRYVADKYDIRVYQSDYIDYAAPKYSSIVAKTYKANGLHALHYVDAGWVVRFEGLLTLYLNSNENWGALLGRLPLYMQPKLLQTHPLSALEVWPNQILADIKRAQKKTLFFAHLLVTHRPFIIRPGGSLRSLEEWRDNEKHVVFYEDQKERYQRVYEAYGEQLQFVARQLDSFLNTLRETGQYDSMSIILHGDHGSRIRLLPSSQRAVRAKLNMSDKETGYYDYDSAPGGRDLENQFATMLAIKPRHATAAQTIEEPGSVLNLFRRHLKVPGQGFPETEIAEKVNSVFLFNEDGHAHEIPILRYWQIPRS